MRDMVLEEDVALVVANERVDWNKFENRTVLVTGATGYIGSLVVKALFQAEKTRQFGLRVLAGVRNVDKAKEVLGACLASGIVQPVLVNCGCGVNIGTKVDYIVHAASITVGKMMTEHPYETILTNVIGTREMLDIAREHQVAGMVYLSSMEVYGQPQGDRYEMTEDMLGFVDPLLPRSSYPESKRMAEGLCAAAAHEFGVPVRIARLAQTFGAGILKTENRVFAQFARAVLSGSDIVLKTDGSKAHCYCYSRDAVVGLLMLLTQGQSGEAYNIANEETFCSIREMAELMIADNSGAGTRLRFDIPADVATLGYPPSSLLKILSGKMRALGWRPTVGLSEMCGRLVQSMQSWGEGDV